MPELAFVSPPARPEVLRQLRSGLAELLRSQKLIAEGLVGEDGPIDFVLAAPDGRVTIVLVGEEGDDLELVGRGLAQRAWVQARLHDWLQIAPDLAIRPEAGVRVALLCPSFRRETVAAARALGDSFALAPYRCVQNGSSRLVLVEGLGEAGETRGTRGLPPGEIRAAEQAPFRTGLSDADLGIEPEERREFE